MMSKCLFSWVMLLTLSAGGYAAAAENDVVFFPIVQNGKWGYMDATGKVVIAPQYDCAWEFSEGLGCVQVGLDRGYIDAKGTMVIQPQYILTRPFSEGLAAVHVGAIKWGGLAMISYGDGAGQWVYIDKTGKVVMTPKDQFSGGAIRLVAGDFHDGHAKVAFRPPWLKSPRQAFLSKDGKFSAPLNSQEVMYVGNYAEGLAAFQLGKKFGYLDTAGKVVIPHDYEDAGDFGQGLVPVAMMVDVNDPARTTTWTKAGKYNLGARNGAERAWGTNSIPMEDGESVAFGATKTFVFSVTAPVKEGKYNFQWQMQAGRAFGDMSSNIVVIVTNAPVASATDTPQKDVAASSATAPAPDKRREDGATGVSQSVPAVMTTGQTYTVSVTMKNTGPKVLKWAYIDKTNAKVIPPQFANARSFSEGLAAVAVSEEKTAAGPGGKTVVTTELRWGCMDKTGKMVIQPQYDFVGPLSEGLARTVVKGKHGYIDATGKTVVEPKFDVGWEFHNGLARVELEGKLGYINKTGKYVWEPKESVYGTANAAVKPEPSAAK